MDISKRDVIYAEVVYLNQVLEVLNDTKPLRDLLAGVAWQVGCAFVGVLAGNMLMGVPGSVIVGLAGSLYGCQYKDADDVLLLSIRSMSDREKTFMGSQVGLLKAAPMPETYFDPLIPNGYKARLFNWSPGLSKLVRTLQNVLTRFTAVFSAKTGFLALIGFGLPKHPEFSNNVDLESVLCVQLIVGSPYIEEFKIYISTKAHRQRILKAFSVFVRQRSLQ